MENQKGHYENTNPKSYKSHRKRQYKFDVFTVDGVS